MMGDLIFEDLILVISDLMILNLTALVALNQWQQAAMVTCNNLSQSCTQYFCDKKLLLLLHGYLHLGDNCESTDHVTGRF